MSIVEVEVRRGEERRGGKRREEERRRAQRRAEQSRAEQTHRTTTTQRSPIKCYIKPVLQSCAVAEIDKLWRAMHWKSNGIQNGTSPLQLCETVQ